VFVASKANDILTDRSTQEITQCFLKKTLINYLCGLKRKAHGAQEPRHIQKYVEVASTAQRSDSPAQAINQRFINNCPSMFITLTTVC